MGKTSSIEWCDSTANPVMGCDGCELHRKGEGESHCYAAGLVGRYAGSRGWPTSFDQPEFFAGRIQKALKWPDLTGKERPGKPWLNGRPRHIFWCDLSDPWTESLPIDWLAPYLPMLADSPHIHIFCTKRPGRARVFFERFRAPKNLILLTTVTSDATHKRAWDLLSVPVYTRGLSLEPLIGPVDLEDYLFGTVGSTAGYFVDGRRVGGGVGGQMVCRRPLNALHWVICGGESGPGARPCDVSWIRSVVRQCRAAGVPAFVKQLGSHAVDTIPNLHGDLTFRFTGAGSKPWGKGGDPEEWPPDLRVREFPTPRESAKEER